LRLEAPNPLGLVAGFDHISLEEKMTSWLTVRFVKQVQLLGLFLSHTDDIEWSFQKIGSRLIRGTNDMESYVPSRIREARLVSVSYHLTFLL
jgi:hypothetical protein